MIVNNEKITLYSYIEHLTDSSSANPLILSTRFWRVIFFAIAATPSEFRQAFSFLEKNPQFSTNANLPEEDFEVLKQINNILQGTRILVEAKDKI